MGRCLVSLLCLGTLLGLCRGFPGSSCPAPSFQRATNDLSQLWDELDGGERDKRFMKMALSQALLAQASNEVPIGAVIVSEDGTVIGEGHNQVEGLGDATAHAEMLAVREASQRQGGWRLEGSTMYCTVEPCAMCLSAAALARVSRVVYGTRDVRLGAAGSWVDLTQSRWLLPHSRRHPYHQIEVEGGVLESANLLAVSFKELKFVGAWHGVFTIRKICSAIYLADLQNQALSRDMMRTPRHQQRSIESS